MFPAFPKRSFLVRAEPEPEAEVVAGESAEENAEAAADVEEAAEAVAEEEVAEVKPPSKPRVKLGDIMGVIRLIPSVAQLYEYHYEA